MKYIILILMAVMTVTAQARIGYNKKQCDKKYGKCISTTKTSTNTLNYVYKKNGIKILAVIFKGKVITMVYSKKGMGTVSMAEALLKSNKMPRSAKFTKKSGDGWYHKNFIMVFESDSIILSLVKELDASTLEKDKEKAAKASEGL